MSASRFFMAGGRSSRRIQAGAALFVSMMILILLSMLALSASQVTSLQQKMASAYWADTRAFENTEAQLRMTEKDVRRSRADSCDAEVLIDPGASWVSSPPVAASATFENLNNAQSDQSRGIGVGGSLRFGQTRDLGDVTCAYFRVSSADFDEVANPSAMVVVQSVFVP